MSRNFFSKRESSSRDSGCCAGYYAMAAEEGYNGYSASSAEESSQDKAQPNWKFYLDTMASIARLLAGPAIIFLGYLAASSLPILGAALMAFGAVATAAATTLTFFSGKDATNESSGDVDAYASAYSAAI